MLVRSGRMCRARVEAGSTLETRLSRRGRREGYSSLYSRTRRVCLPFGWASEGMPAHSGDGRLNKMKVTLITIGAAVLLSLGSTASAVVGYVEGFESETHSWNSYMSQLEIVSSGTDGVSSSGGSYHLRITDPEGSEDSTGAYTYQGGKSNVWGGGWSSTIDVYIDLDDSHVKDGTYFWNLSQHINRNTGDYGKDNFFHLGAVDDGAGGYQLAVNSGHSGSGNTVLDPANYHSESYGTFSETGWYTFMWEFGPSTSTQHPDEIDVTWTVFDGDGTVVWSANETNEELLESEAGGNRYLWFTDIGADRVLIDNATVVPEPATMSLLGLGGLALLRRRRKA